MFSRLLLLLTLFAFLVEVAEPTSNFVRVGTSAFGQVGLAVQRRHHHRHSCATAHRADPRKLPKASSTASPDEDVSHSATAVSARDDVQRPSPGVRRIELRNLVLSGRDPNAIFHPPKPAFLA